MSHTVCVHWYVTHTSRPSTQHNTTSHLYMPSLSLTHTHTHTEHDARSSGSLHSCHCEGMCTLKTRTGSTYVKGSLQPHKMSLLISFKPCFSHHFLLEYNACRLCFETVEHKPRFSASTKVSTVGCLVCLFLCFPSLVGWPLGCLCTAVVAKH